MVVPYPAAAWRCSAVVATSLPLVQRPLWASARTSASDVGGHRRGLMGEQSRRRWEEGKARGRMQRREAVPSSSHAIVFPSRVFHGQRVAPTPTVPSSPRGRARSRSAGAAAEQRHSVLQALPPLLLRTRRTDERRPEGNKQTIKTKRLHYCGCMLHLAAPGSVSWHLVQATR